MNEHDDVTAWQPAGDERTFEEWSLDVARWSLKHPGRTVTLEEFIRARKRKDAKTAEAEQDSATAA